MTTLLNFYKSELKARPLMPALLAQAGIQVPHSRLIRVPTYEDTRASAYVYPDSVCDYGDANKTYDLLAVAQDWLGLQFEQAVGLLADLAGIPAPVKFEGEVKRVQYRDILPTARIDPNEYAVFASRSHDAFQNPQTQAAEAAHRYLQERGLHAAPFVYGLGIADSTVPSRLPHSIWQDMLTFPTWHSGQLLALKGRNLLPKEAGREMRNLSGTGTAPYGLRELGDSGAVLIVEGETDTLSVWEAFEGEINVLGIPGATHWKKLQHLALAGRRLFLCLDSDTAGTRAMNDCQRWAAEEGRHVHLVGGIGDKNAILCEHGPAYLRQLLTAGVKGSTRRAVRRIL